MRSSLPFATLGLLLLASGAILVGGIHLARREERVRVADNRAALTTVASGMNRELNRLDRLYESHLRELVRATVPLATDRQAVWQRCDRIVGVSQWSLIHVGSSERTDIHLAIDAARPRQWPEPTFSISNGGLPHQQLLLPAEELLRSDSEPWGWIDDPGKPLFFWQRISGDTAAVLVIDPQPIDTALDRWFSVWAQRNFAAALTGGRPAALMGPGETTIATAGAIPKASPDFLSPLRSRFGTWQFATWDRIETRIHYDALTQAAAVAFAVALALLGSATFVQQRRMLRLATERVTFVNRVSHELRSPLTNILLNLDLASEAIEETEFENSPASGRLALVREEAHRLGRLIENVLTFSRKERAPLKTEARPCIPAKVIDSVVDQFATSFARRRLTVCCMGTASAACLLDADALAQILANLLSNVEKYVPEGVVRITAELAAETLTITVADEGPGIPASEAERIFRPFERLDSRVNEGSSGTGLGLAIARDLAERMGGSLSLIPSPRGACFSLRIPTLPVSRMNITTA